MHNITSVSLIDIINPSIPKQFRDRSKNCTLKQIDYIAKNPNRIILYMVCHESWSDPAGQYVTFVFPDYVPKKRDTSKPLNSEIKMKCTCPWWKFGGPSYNATLGEYNWDFTENRFPEIKDPNLVNKVCKHVLKAYDELKHKTFKQLKKKYVRANMIFDLPTVSVEETLPAVESFIKRNGIKSSDKFLLEIDRNNFEEKLKEIGAII